MRVKGAALAVCTVGMALLTLNGELRPASGDLICLITPLCYAVDLLITEKAVRDPRVDPLGLGVCQLAVVGIVTLALALVLGEPVHLPTSGKTWAAALFLATRFFGQWEDRQRNPNAQVQSSHGQGFVEVRLLGNGRSGRQGGKQQRRHRAIEGGEAHKQSSVLMKTAIVSSPAPAD